MIDALGRPQSALVLGGSSDIARATVRALAATLSTLVLAGRPSRELELAAREARSAGIATVEVLDWDATEMDRHAQRIGKVFDAHEDVDLVLVAAGVLGEQSRDEADPVAAAQVITTNFTGPAAACLAVAERLREQGHGVLVVVSSVAGERVRRANFIYGSSKAGLDGFAQGLGYSLSGSGARVMIVRPGFVHTRMTAGRAPQPFAITADQLAAAVVKGLERGTPVVWAPAALRPVMAVMRHLPAAVFSRIGR